MSIEENILARMYRRRQFKQKEYEKLTLSYAISVSSGHCYVGWNSWGGLLRDDGSEKVQRRKSLIEEGTIKLGGEYGGISIDDIYKDKDPCAEASALYLAMSYDEPVDKLVFFATNS